VNEALSKEFKLSKEIQVDATELRIRAERRLGEMLKVMEKEKGGRPTKNQSLESTSFSTISTLQDIGITKNDSSKFQRLASIDEPSFETAVTNLKEQAIAGKPSALSTVGVIKDKFSKSVH
jgi:hypothetical protein